MQEYYDKLISSDIVKDLTVIDDVRMYRRFSRNYQIFEYYDIMEWEWNWNLKRNSFGTVKGFSKNV